VSLSVRGLLARHRFYFSAFLLFLFVISLVSIGMLLRVIHGPDLWVADINIILASRSRMTSIGLGFSAFSVKE
jgi:hypothetical protein